MNRLALFDCDGTLVDSQANICLAMEAAFDGAGLIAPDRPTIRRIVGLSLPQAMAALLPDADAAFHEHLAAAYKAEFLKLRASGAMLAEPLYDGIADLLAVLSDAGWVMGVATGKSDRGLALILAHHGIDGYFTTLQTADRHPSKPHPSMAIQAMAEAGAAPQATVMIGDTHFDMAMAAAAGAHGVGVAWGYHAPDELIAAGAAWVAADARQLHALEEALA